MSRSYLSLQQRIRIVVRIDVLEIFGPHVFDPVCYFEDGGGLKKKMMPFNSESYRRQEATNRMTNRDFLFSRIGNVGFVVEFCHVCLVASLAGFLFVSVLQEVLQFLF